MGKPKFTEIYKWVIITVLTAILGFAMSDIGLLGSPQKYFFILYIASALLISILIVQLTWIIIGKIRSQVNSFFKTPNFRNVRVSFLETKTGEISIQIYNKEWRYPEIQAEAIIDISHTKPNKQLIPELGLETDPDFLSNLKWKERNNPGLSTIEKNHYKHLSFAHTDSTRNEFYLDVWRGTPPRFSVGKHEIRVVLYITIEKIMIARTLVVEVIYEGENKIAIANIIPLQDIPQKVTVSRFSAIDI